MQNAQRAQLILQKFVYLVLPRNALMFETSLHEDKGLVWLSVALDQDDFLKKMISSKGDAGPSWIPWCAAHLSVCRSISKGKRDISTSPLLRYFYI